MKTEPRGSTAPISLPSHGLLSPSSTSSSSSSNSLPGALKGCLGSLDGACIEKLLLHCASALEINDVTLAQQVMWVLNNVASPVGDPNQRLTSWFLRALISRASRVCPTPMGNLNTSSTLQRRLLSGTELAGYVDLIPWHRFGFCAANSAIYKAVQGYPRIHILDFSITHCMQWPTLIDALAKRPEGPPSLRISVPCTRPHVPPLLNVSIDDIGIRLGNFARCRNIPFEFDVMNCSSSSSGANSIEMTTNNSKELLTFNIDFLLDCLSPHALNLRDDEVLVVNCQSWLRYLPDGQLKNSTNHIHEASCSIRDTFLELLRSLNPHIMIIVDEDADLNSTSLTSRIATCFNYLWIPFDALETFLPKESSQRIEYEADIGHKIESIIGCEGFHRIERLESSLNMSQRIKTAGFLSVPFSEETVKDVKLLLDEHASGWGMKRDDDALILTWKGHNSVYASTWVPNGSLRD
uniref:Scarecrow-like protein 32 n=1 Tax=Kalanchoe fedtschenkoi TaxID=63787 RepID=A0A7N0TI14_KALFE